LTRSARAFEWVKSRLDSRRVALWAIALGVLLSSPALLGGFQTEDWVFRSLVRDFGVHLPGHVNLWERPLPSDKGADAGPVHAQMNLGLLPWITAPNFAVSFWRPVTSLTHQLDYSAWSDAPALMHAENLAWYAALIAAAAVLYRRLLAPSWVAGLAAFLYAVDDAHGQAVGWITNRNGLMAGSFAAFALCAHDRARRDGSRAGSILATLLFALALGSGETALGALGYLVAYALFIDRAPWPRRLLGAAPWLVVALVWAVAYRALGYGVSGSGLYVDPYAQPAQFLKAIALRAPALLLGALAAPPSDLWMTLGREQVAWAAALACAALLALAAVIVPWLRRQPEARFWSLGAVLSVLPACAVFPEDRLLLLPTLGGMAVVAGFAADVFARGTPALSRVLASLLLAVHALAAPLLLPWRVLAMQRYDARLAAARDSAYGLVRDKNQELLLLNAPDFYFAVMLLFTRAARGESLPKRQLCLAGTLRDVIVHRPNAKTLEVLRAEGFLEEPFNRLYRSERKPIKRGTTIAFEGFELEVTRVTERGAPSGVVFRFKSDLDAKKYVWAKWRAGRYVPFSLPASGETLVIKG